MKKFSSKISPHFSASSERKIHSLVTLSLGLIFFTLGSCGVNLPQVPLAVAPSSIAVPPAKSIPTVEVPKSEPISSIPRWTEDEAVALAKMLWGEARGVESTTQQAACVWCVLNRCDEWDMSILAVVTAPYQFAGYDPSHPVDDALLALCEDVLTRYFAEKDGEVNVGRVLPPDYLFFSGDGKCNYFRNSFKDGQIWDWTLPSPYES